MNLRGIPSIISAEQWFPKIPMDGPEPVPGKPGFYRMETKHGVVDMVSGDYVIRYKNQTCEVRRVNGGIIQGRR